MKRELEQVEGLIGYTHVIKVFDVQFDNKPAERSLRMMKSKLKVSGGVRTEEMQRHLLK